MFMYSCHWEFRTVQLKRTIAKKIIFRLRLLKEQVRLIPPANQLKTSAQDYRTFTMTKKRNVILKIFFGCMQ